MWRIVKSPFGLALMGIRDSEERMRALGHDVQRQKLLAFVIAGTFAALAGGLFAYKQTFINPDSAIGLVPLGRALLDGDHRESRHSGRPPRSAPQGW